MIRTATRYSSAARKRQHRTPLPTPYLTLGSAFGLLVVGGLVFGLGSWLSARGVGGLELAFWRALLAGGAFFVHAGFQGSLHASSPGKLAALALAGFYGLYLPLALPHTGPLIGFLLLIPALLAVTLWPVRGQILRKLNGVLVGVLALGLLAGATGLSRGDFATSLGWGGLTGVGLVAYLLLARPLAARLSPLTLHALTLPLGALLLWPLSGTLAPAFAVKGAEVWAGLVLLAGLSSYGLYALHYTLLTSLGTPRAQAVTSAEPVAALLTLSPFLLELPWLALPAAGCVLLLILRTRLSTSPLPHPGTPLDTRTKKRLLRARVHGMNPDARYNLEGWLKGGK